MSGEVVRDVLVDKTSQAQARNTIKYKPNFWPGIELENEAKQLKL